MPEYGGFGVDPQDVWDAGRVHLMKVATTWNEALERSNETCRTPPHFRSPDGGSTTSAEVFNQIAMDLNTDSRAVTERLIAAGEDLATAAEMYLEADEDAVRALETSHEDTPATFDDPVSPPDVADEVEQIDYQESQQMEAELDAAN